jgi:hypothetical protein
MNMIDFEKNGAVAERVGLGPDCILAAQNFSN